MSVKHVQSLIFKSAQIQREIEKEQSYRWPDWLRLLWLKKLRLVIKDRLERMIQHGKAKGHFSSVKVTMPRKKLIQQS